jgi:hypothetical protein
VDLGDVPGKSMVLRVLEIARDGHHPVAHVDLNIRKLSRSYDLAFDLPTDDVVTEISRGPFDFNSYDNPFRRLGWYSIFCRSHPGPRPTCGR